MGLLGAVKKTTSSGGNDKSIVMLDIAKVKEDKMQVRKLFDDNKLQELADSIKENGVISPIIVRPNGDLYQIIAGERRYRASIIAGVETIPAIIRDVDNAQAKNMQLIENLQRQDITAIETANAISSLTNNGVKQEEISKQLGISKASVSKYSAIGKIEELPQIQESTPQAGMEDLYKIAKETNTRKRNRLLSQLLGTTDDKTDSKDSAPEEPQLDLQHLWTILKREVRKDEKNLLKYLSSKKIQKLLDLDN